MKPVSVNDGTIAAADLNTINGYTTGFVTSTATKITGSTADLVNNCSSSCRYYLH